MYVVIENHENAKAFLYEHKDVNKKRLFAELIQELINLQTKTFKQQEGDWKEIKVRDCNYLCKCRMESNKGGEVLYVERMAWL